MKKKITALFLCVALAAIAIVGASLAYFSDTDNKTNTFTVGGVKIDLIEQQSNEDHTGFVPYTGDKVLMPIVGSAQGEKYPNGQPKAANYIDKVVTIQNTGKSAAWIRAYYAVPSDLDDGYETFNAGANILHGNFGNKIVDGTVYTTFGAEWNWMHDGKWNYFETTMDGVNYNVYFADYYQPVAANETTEQLICGVYLDKNVDMKDGKYIDTRTPTPTSLSWKARSSIPYLRLLCRLTALTLPQLLWMPPSAPTTILGAAMPPTGSNSPPTGSRSASLTLLSPPYFFAARVL